MNVLFRVGQSQLPDLKLHYERGLIMSKISNSPRFSTRQLTLAAVIGAIYVALTMLTQPISFGPAQLRIAEAMTVLPFLAPFSMWGLFVGCALSNLLGGYGIIDIVFGSLATLLAGFLTSRCKNRWLAPLPPVIVNALVIGGVLTYATTDGGGLQAYLLIAGQLFVEQALVCYCLGLPLLLLFEKNNFLKKLFQSEK